MDQTVSDLWKELRTMYQPLEKWMKIAGLKRSNIELPYREKDIEHSDSKIKEHHVHECLKWVRNKLMPACRAVKAVRDLCPDHAWDNYSSMEIEGLCEQDMLEDASKKLRKLWRQRPSLLRKRDKWHGDGSSRKTAKTQSGKKSS